MKNKKKNKIIISVLFLFFTFCFIVLFKGLNNSIQLKPELRIYNQPITITTEADIKTTFYYDKFLVMNLVKDNEYFNVRYQVKPFMIWIWVSTILIVIGGLLSLCKRLYEK